MTKKKNTIDDVAKEAGVSLGTASRVLNRKKNVAKKYVDLVNQAIDKLGYTPNPIARSLMNANSVPKMFLNETSSIGFLENECLSIDAFLKNDYLHCFFAGIEAALRARDLNFLFAACNATINEDVKNGRLPLMVRDRKVEGIIIKTGEWQQADWVDAIASVLPVVLIDNRFVRSDIPSVTNDNVSASRTIMQYLKDLGHQRIGFFQVDDVNAPVSHRTIHKTERLAAYRQCVTEMSLMHFPGYEQVPERDWNLNSLDDVAGKVLDEWMAMGAERPTAVYCGADVYAFSLITEAQKRGLRIPDDLSVIGLLNRHACESSIVPLTSMSVPGEDIGQTAVEILCDRIEHPEKPVRHVTIVGQLYERASCSAPSEKNRA